MDEIGYKIYSLFIKKKKKELIIVSITPIKMIFLDMIN